MAADEIPAGLPVDDWAKQREARLREIAAAVIAAGDTRAAQRAALQQIGELDQVAPNAARQTLSKTLLDLRVEAMVAEQ